jgi:drug/metabolite transporter (DMT)-like permease
VITTGYGLVLVAMPLARDVSYVSAFRQVSIPIGALLGILALKEPAYPFKLAGTGILFVGLVLVGLG